MDTSPEFNISLTFHKDLISIKTFRDNIDLCKRVVGLHI